MSNYWLFLVLIFSASSEAQQQAHSDPATILFEAMYSEESVQQTVDRTISQMPELLAQMGVPEERQAKSEQHLEEVAAVMKEYMTSEKMRDQFVAAYAEVYTEEELRELADFYTSSIGKKVLQKQPEMTQVAMQMVGEMMQELMPRLKEISSKAKVGEDEAETEENR